MPKKDVSAVSSTAQAQQEAASEGIDAYELPKSLVTRLARSAVRLYTTVSRLSERSNSRFIVARECEDAERDGAGVDKGFNGVCELPR